MFSPMMTTPKCKTITSDKNIAHESATDADALAHSPAVQTTMLLVRWEIAVRARAWWSAGAIAQELIALLPAEPIGWIYQAFSQQQLGRLQEARRILLKGARKFPTDWRIAYNLACYNAQLGDLAGAWNWLERAFELGNPAIIKPLAADEPSLKPLLERSALESVPSLRQPTNARSSESDPGAFAV